MDEKEFYNLVTSRTLTLEEQLFSGTTVTLTGPNLGQGMRLVGGYETMSGLPPFVEQMMREQERMMLELRMREEEKMLMNTNPADPDPKIWVTKEGNAVRICDMTEMHLFNTIKLLRSLSSYPKRWFGYVQAMEDELMWKKVKRAEATNAAMEKAQGASAGADPSPSRGELPQLQCEDQV